MSCFVWTIQSTQPQETSPPTLAIRSITSIVPDIVRPEKKKEGWSLHTQAELCGRNWINGVYDIVLQLVDGRAFIFRLPPISPRRRHSETSAMVPYPRGPHGMSKPVQKETPDRGDRDTDIRIQGEDEAFVAAFNNIDGDAFCLRLHGHYSYPRWT